MGGRSGGPNQGSLSFYVITSSDSCSQYSGPETPHEKDTGVLLGPSDDPHATNTKPQHGRPCQ